MSDPNIALYALSPAQLAQRAAEWGEPAYRARQVSGWIHQRGACDLAEMSNVPKALRERIAGLVPCRRFRTVSRLASSDGSLKFAFELEDGSIIESVLIRSRDHLTVVPAIDLGVERGRCRQNQAQRDGRESQAGRHGWDSLTGCGNGRHRWWQWLPNA